MWVIPTLTPEFIERMESLLNLYALPYNEKEPVICCDEKSKQLLQDTHAAILGKEGVIAKRDYEYKRNGTRNIFVSVEPKGGYRKISVTKKRTKQDFAKEIRTIVTLKRYRGADKIHLVVDNLNTHFGKSFLETFSKMEAESILQRIEFHYTPKHASWLNMAEVEISIFSKQSIRGRIGTEEDLRACARIWQKQRNLKKSMIAWKFTVQDARAKLKYEPKRLS